MKTIHELFDEYGESHQNEKNKAIHFVCVPLIFFSIIGLLSALPSISLYKILPPFLESFAHFGTLLVLFGLIFYVRLSVPIALGMFLVSVICLFSIKIMNEMNLAPLWLVSLVIFIAAWIGQFYGHKIEGKKPSFLKDLQFLLVGPAWILGFIYRKMGIKY